MVTLPFQIVEKICFVFHLHSDVALDLKIQIITKPPAICDLPVQEFLDLVKLWSDWMIVQQSLEIHLFVDSNNNFGLCKTLDPLLSQVST